MNAKAEELQRQCEALEAYYKKLSKDFYLNFKFKQINDLFPASSFNTILVTKNGEKRKMEQSFIEVKSVIASALEAYIEYKNSWFSDDSFVKHAKQLIDKVSNEYDKIQHFFYSYKIIED